MKYKILIFFLLLIPNYTHGHVFQFNDEKGVKYHIRTFSIQEVLHNNILRGTFDLKYEGYLEVINITSDGAHIKGKYLYYNKPYATPLPYKLENMYHTNTRFIRKKNGAMMVDKSLFFPVVRHVPKFPDQDISIGMGWSARGEEAQDLRKLGIQNPYIMPFNAKYRYLRDEVFRGKNCAIIEIIYIINRSTHQRIGVKNNLIPGRIMGYFKGNYYWDKDSGYPVYYEGDYNFIYVLMNGEVREFRGKEYGDVTKDPDLRKIVKIKPEKEKLDKEIKKKIEKDNLKFPVEKKDDKIVINLGELLFDFNSSELRKDTITQLDKLAKILMKYDNLDITVEGHTDSIGNETQNLELSELRAKSVRDYLVQKGVSPKRIKSNGFGKSRPIATNDTPEGRRKNRRVEIIIHLKKPEEKK